MTCDDAGRLVEAYADGELDLERTLAVETHVAGCAVCAARVDRMQALVRTLGTAPYFRAPDGLVSRLRTATRSAAVSAPRGQPEAARGLPEAARGQPEATGSPRRLWRPWLAAAAGIAVVSVALIGVLHERAVMANEATTEAVIEGHVRSLMAGHLTDVASSDRHTVKPWFAGRVDFSPVVVDLASEGFPLVGGRLDYINHHAAAALVYKRREHAINVFVWPDAAGSPAEAARSDPRGYHLISWTRGGTAVWIVSDVALNELEDFARKFDAATRN
jgi:anti-sigma factor RsiW